MKVGKVKIIGSSKVYWLTEAQAKALEVALEKSPTKLLSLGEDKVKASLVKTIEFEEEDLSLAPKYFKDAILRESPTGLPAPQEKKVFGKHTRYFFKKSGHEIIGQTLKKIYDLHVPIIEKDYEYEDCRKITTPTGETTWAYTYTGKIKEERLVEYIEEDGVGYNVITSIKRNGVEQLKH